MTNKERFELWLKVVTLFLWGLVAIITSATALNAAPGGFLSVVAVLNIVVAAIGIVKGAKRISQAEREAGR